MTKSHRILAFLFSYHLSFLSEPYFLTWVAINRPRNTILPLFIYCPCNSRAVPHQMTFFYLSSSCYYNYHYHYHHHYYYYYYYYYLLLSLCVCVPSFELFKRMGIFQIGIQCYSSLVQLCLDLWVWARGLELSLPYSLTSHSKQKEK